MPSIRPLAEVALEVCREQKTPYVWYGNPQLLHDIYERGGRKRARHPLNISAAIVGACARSPLWQRSGYVQHLGRKYPVYKPRTPGSQMMPSIREIAEDIGVQYGGFRAESLAGAVEQAIRNERERCAKIVNNARSEGADLRELVARIRDDNYEVEL